MQVLPLPTPVTPTVEPLTHESYSVSVLRDGTALAEIVQGRMRSFGFEPAPETTRAIRAQADEFAAFLTSNPDPRISEVLAFLKSLETARAEAQAALQAAQAQLKAAQDAAAAQLQAAQAAVQDAAQAKPVDKVQGHKAG